MLQSFEIICCRRSFHIPGNMKSFETIQSLTKHFVGDHAKWKFTFETHKWSWHGNFYYEEVGIFSCQIFLNEGGRVLSDQCLVHSCRQM